MRAVAFLSLFGFAALSLVNAVPVTRTETCMAEMCPSSSPSTTVTERSKVEDTNTNAYRLSRGLAPLKPKALFSPESAPRPRTSSVAYRARIAVSDANGNLLGYFAKNLVNGGAQAGYDPDIANALLVDFSLPLGVTTGTVEMTAENMNPSWPLVGLVQGRDDTNSVMAPNSYQYGYVAGTTHTDPNSRPALVDNSYFIGSPRTAESVVWSVDVLALSVAPVWVNPDGTLPTLEFWTQSTGLYFGGSSQAFFARFPAPITKLTATLILL